MSFAKVLFIGPNYKNVGLAHYPSLTRPMTYYKMFETYEKNVSPFKYVAYCNGFEVRALDKRLGNLVSFWKLFKLLIKDPEIQIVHCHESINGGLLAPFLFFLMAKLLFRKKVVFHTHALYTEEVMDRFSWVKKRLVRYYFSHVDMVICFNEENFSFIKGCLQPRSIFIVNDALDLDIKGNHCLAVDEGIGFLYVDQATGIENAALEASGLKERLIQFLDLLEKEKRTYASLTQFNLLIEGISEAQSRWIEKEVKTRGLASFVKLSAVARIEKEAACMGNHVCILGHLSSRSRFDLLEVLKNGLPVIAPRAAITESLISEAENGFFYLEGEIERLKRAIDYFIHRPTEISFMGLRAGELIRSYDIQQVKENLSFLYLNLLNE